MVDLYRPDAVVFFSRDFLASEFARLASHFGDLERVYIVAAEKERQVVLGLDPAAHVFRLGDAVFDGAAAALDIEINRDRFLRFMTAKAVATVMRDVAGVADAVLARFRPIYYFDEPVSGYPNAEFNRRFRAAGALALHFQTSWLPGYGFFTSDAAQREPVPLAVVTGGREATRAHVAVRQTGGGRPLYVIGYGKISKRVTDIAKTVGKMAYRRWFRRGQSYIARDTSEHRTHARALLHSLAGRRYAPHPARGKYLLFPLHYEPESVLSYFSPYQRQEEVAATLLDSLPADWTLVLKEHPSQPGALRLPKWAELRSAGRVIGLPGAYPASRLLEYRPIVVSIGSTLALEAALAGCPTGVLGDVHFADAPGVTRLAHPGDWLRLIDAPGAEPDAVVDWYGDFMDRFCFRGIIMRGRTTIDDMPEVVAALARQRGAAARENPRKVAAR